MMNRLFSSSAETLLTPRNHRTPAWLTPFTTAEAAVCPIVLDLDGNGVQVTGIEQGVFFDHNGDGFAEQSAWASSTDGILVRDLNGDGQITNGNELIGDQTLMKNGKVGMNGFEVLNNHKGSETFSFSELSQ